MIHLINIVDIIFLCVTAIFCIILKHGNMISLTYGEMTKVLQSSKDNCPLSDYVVFVVNKMLESHWSQYEISSQIPKIDSLSGFTFRNNKYYIL